MIDDNWEAINGDAAHEIEVLNYSNQVNVIHALVHFLMHHLPAEDGTCGGNPSERVLMEFHRTATLFLLHRPGEYRQAPVWLSNAAGVVVYQPPEADAVPSHMKVFFEGLQSAWLEKAPAEIGAYCLWMINWVHPFINGNGRTARAFCYACLCLKLGFVLPGDKTVIDLIMDQREDYYAALRVADAAYATNGEPDLGPMIGFVDRLLFEQLTSIGSVDDGGYEN